MSTEEPGAAYTPLWRDPRTLGFFGGFAAFALVLALPLPPGLSSPAHRMAAIVVLMAVWWMTEALPIAITALVPFACYPLLGIASATDAAVAYANHHIFLFLGGFLLAIAMQRWGLHRRMALFLLARIGGSPHRLVLGFMIVTAFLSMWVSNTATVVMLFPIALAVVNRIVEGDPRHAPTNTREKAQQNFAIAMLLGIAYAASIGGVATLVGSPPNIIFVGILRQLYPEAPSVSFTQWMAIGLPLTMLFLPFAWWALTRLIWPFQEEHFIGDQTLLTSEYQELEPMSRGEWLVLSVFVATAGLWLTRRGLNLGGLRIPGWTSLFGQPELLQDSTVAIVMGVLLFCIPVSVKTRTFLLDQTWYREIPWDILVLFGGGFALAHGFQQTGLSQWLAGYFSALGSVPLPLLVVLIAIAMTFLTEVTSNTATVTVMLPILASTAQTLGLHPYLLMLPATLAASYAFMLPMATPPNALVFSGGYLSVSQMARTGLILNVVGTLLIALVVFGLSRWVFEFDFTLPIWAQQSR